MFWCGAHLTKEKTCVCICGCSRKRRNNNATTRQAQSDVNLSRYTTLATAEAKEKYGTADAWEDLLQLLEAHWPTIGAGANGGIMHCFSGTVDQANRSLAANFHLSFAGNLTYPRSTSIREAATLAPANRILVETDAPFLTPIPHRGKQNEPAFITHTATFLATLRGISTEQLAALTTENFKHLFNLQ